MVIIHATKYDNDPIHIMHMRNVIGNHLFNLGRSQSGMVSIKRKWIGHITNHMILRKQLFSFGKRINEYPFGIISTSAISFGWLSGTVITSFLLSLADFDSSDSTTSSAPSLLTTFLFKSAIVSSFVLASMWAIFFIFPFCWKCSMVSAGIFSNLLIIQISFILPTNRDCIFCVEIPSSVQMFDSRLPLCDRRFRACLTPPTNCVS